MKVCVLSQGETDALKNGEPICCALHQHISQEEAWGLTAQVYMQRDGIADKPIAEWVGPNHIRYVLQHTWKNLHRSMIGPGAFLRLKTRQLVAGFR